MQKQERMQQRRYSRRRIQRVIDWMILLAATLMVVAGVFILDRALP